MPRLRAALASVSCLMLVVPDVDAGRRRHRIELDLELVELELFLDGVDDAVTDVNRKADRLLVVVQIGKRNRRVAEADGDRAGLLDFFQRAFELFGVGLPDAESSGEREAHHTQVFHSGSPPLDDFRNACKNRAGMSLPAVIRPPAHAMTGPLHGPASPTSRRSQDPGNPKAWRIPSSAPRP